MMPARDAWGAATRLSYGCGLLLGLGVSLVAWVLLVVLSIKLATWWGWL
jgi:hypothetical protein